ncbi:MULTISPECIES: DUF916 domain-containing protein [unclassified Solwaraspora]|uniref:WxL protein peptidoglycan domain-containing protein n=1 Tax=unclassified Solwaraspora TaxID=2627926 RepID=UPI00248BD30B|nr:MULTISPECIES: DUF916 domain-containing protein [unclassified Solwaraspora]WBB95966.1 DUF916 domain-containing protein [Solwaraspora sp. WMMA2059]WBC20130.1 DUF916 domain-containing protein [Solwaraspora sp. WMMA2080]WJK32283.1 DUF916 domain-containing protein [Solwaraspora sp. WMMA2065]
MSAPPARRPHRRRAAIGLLVAGLLALPGATPAAAQPAGPAPADAVTWAVQPSSADGPTGRNYFVYDLAPGAEITDHVAVRNLGDQDRTFTVYGTDGFLTDDGAFALLPADQPATDVGTWIHFDQREYAIPGGERLDIPFRLTVPANATPGDHAGGVIGSIAQLRTDASGQQVNVDQRVAARVYLRVDGPVLPAVNIESMSISYDDPVNPLGDGDVEVTYQVRNTGNIRVGGTGAVLLDGPLGWELARTDPVDLPELLPGSTFTVTEKITGVPPALRLTATVDLAPTTVDEALPPVTRTAGIWAPPWLLLATIVALAGWFGVRRWRARRAAAAVATPASPAVTPASNGSPDVEPAEDGAASSSPASSPAR